MRHHELVQNTLRVLEEQGFDIFAYFSSCVDIAAQKRRLKLLIKILENVDSMKREHADDLKRLAKFVGGYPIILGEHTKAEALMDDAVYERHGISCLNANTLESSLRGEYPQKACSQGRMIVEVDARMLTKARTDAGMSMEQLANELAVSKESVYNYEKEYTRMRFEVAQRIEKILDRDIIARKKPFISPDIDSRPEGPLANRLMFLDFDVYSFSRLRPGIAAADGKDRVFVEERMGPQYKKEREFSEFFNAFLTVIGGEGRCGSTVISPGEFREIRTKKELMDLIREKTE